MIPALYCHIPFCKSICPFCAFAVHGAKKALFKPYLNALYKEITLQRKNHPEVQVSSLYFGGGTPSSLEIQDFSELMAHLEKTFPFDPQAEIAFEVNPEDGSHAYFKGLMGEGVNRVSLGAQSFHDPTLKSLGRNHDAKTALKAIEALRGSGMKNFNLDLICGAPRQDEVFFLDDLNQSLGLSPNHLSLYLLELESATPFGRNGDVVAWEDSHREAQAEAYLEAVSRLQVGGYKQYEVSNFAKKGFEGRQNLLVWSGENYLGLGLGAHSYVDGVRMHNHRKLKAYCRDLEAGKLPVAFREELTPVQMANEVLMLALRQTTGLDISAWEARFGFSWGDNHKRTTDALCQQNLARFENNQLKLTPAGLLVADELTARLMVES